MPDRRYTLAEIDLMRAGIRRRNETSYPENITYFTPASGGRSKMDEDSAAAIEKWERKCEEQLRTALLAGVDPAEFE